MSEQDLHDDIQVTDSPRPPLGPWPKITWSLSQLGHGTIESARNGFLIFFLLGADNPDNALLDPAILSALIIFGRLIDSIADPMIASWSDRSHSRFGRRSIFMLWNGAPMVLTAVLAFFPPFRDAPTEAQKTWNAVYVAVILGAYFFFFTGYVAPWLALFPELVRSHAERVSMATYKAYGFIAGIIVGMLVAPLMVQRWGSPTMMLIFLVPCLVLVYMPLVGIREKEMCDSQPSTVPMIPSLIATLRNGPFLLFLCARQTYEFGFNMVQTALPYFITLVLLKEIGYQGALLGGTFAVMLLSMSPLSIVARRVGNKRMMLISMYLFTCTLPMWTVAGLIESQTLMLITAHVMLAAIGFPVAISTLLGDPFIGEISDLDRKATGQQREAMYYGSQGFFSKLLTWGIAPALGVMVMTEGYQYDTPQRGGVLAIGIVGSLFCLAGTLLFHKYPEKYDAESGTFYLDYDTTKMAKAAAASSTS